MSRSVDAPRPRRSPSREIAPDDPRVVPVDSGRFQLTLTTGTRLIVSRPRGAALRRLML